MPALSQESVVFGTLLDGLLELMSSEYGFIGEIKYEQGNDGGGGGDGTAAATTATTMYLQTHAITNIAWNEETRQFYEENASQGLKFYNLNSLFGTVMTSREPVISNEPKKDDRACGIPSELPLVCM